MPFTEVDIQLSNGSKLSICHNLPLEGPNNIVDAIEVWRSKTDQLTAESFCSYIDQKRKKGLCDWFAFPSVEALNTWAEQLSQVEYEAHFYSDLSDTVENKGIDTPKEFQDVWKINFKNHKQQFSHKGTTYFLEIKPYQATSEQDRTDFKLGPQDYLIHLLDGANYQTFKMTSSLDDACNFVWETAPKMALGDKKLVDKIGEHIIKLYD
jgi:hypothetical protein